MDSVVRNTLHAACKQSAKTRQTIAEEMSRLVCHPVSVAMLDAFMAESKAAHRFPAAWLSAFCVVTRDDSALRSLVEAAGYHLITDQEAMLIELARAYLQHKNSAEKMSSLEHRLMRGNRDE
jgi:hypothetical protein